MRAYIKFTSLPAAGNAAHLLEMWGDAEANPAVYVRNNGGVYEWGVYSDQGSTTYFASPNPTTGTWYCVEMKWVSATECRLYIDGVSVGVTGTPPTTDTQSRGYVGYSSGDSSITFYADCVVIDTAYIGTEAPPAGITVKKGSSQGSTVTTALNSKMFFGMANRFPKLSPRQIA
jgi:hypothetical protein